MDETYETHTDTSTNTSETFSSKNRTIVKLEVALTILAFICLFILTFLGATIVLVATFTVMAGGAH